MKKNVITGTSCSGKTTLGKLLGSKLNVPYTDLDDLYWLPNWIPRDEEEFGESVREKFCEERWVITGNYTRFSNHLWPKADLVIWLDLPLSILLWRGLKRSLKQIFSGEEICNGNRQTFFRLFGPQSVFYYILRGYPQRKRTNKAYFEKQKNTSQKTIRVKNRDELELLIKNFDSKKVQ